MLFLEAGSRWQEHPRKWDAKAEPPTGNEGKSFPIEDERQRDADNAKLLNDQVLIPTCTIALQ